MKLHIMKFSPVPCHLVHLCLFIYILIHFCSSIHSFLNSSQTLPPYTLIFLHPKLYSPNFPVSRIPLSQSKVSITPSYSIHLCLGPLYFGFPSVSHSTILSSIAVCHTPHPLYTPIQIFIVPSNIVITTHQAFQSVHTS
jgi:hypothetical protein